MQSNDIPGKCKNLNKFLKSLVPNGMKIVVYKKRHFQGRLKYNLNILNEGFLHKSKFNYIYYPYKQNDMGLSAKFEVKIIFKLPFNYCLCQLNLTYNNVYNLAPIRIHENIHAYDLGYFNRPIEDF